MSGDVASGDAVGSGLTAEAASLAVTG